jgi:2-iminobutanoate/2-iminopropanoate deaminase
MRKSVTAPGIVATGPYAHAVESEGLLFLSGQTPIDPATGKLIQAVLPSRRNCVLTT